MNSVYTTLLVSLFTGLLIGMGSGVNVAVARGLGMGDRQRVEKTVHTSFVLCAAIGVVLCLICVLLARPMLTLLHTKAAIEKGSQHTDQSRHNNSHYPIWCDY